MTPVDLKGNTKVVSAPKSLRSSFARATNDWLVKALGPREHLLFDRRTGRGAIDKRGTWLLAGAGESGKSYASLDLALAVATGSAWYDLETSGRPGRVLLIVAEDTEEDIRRRLKWIADRRYPSADIEDRILILHDPTILFVQQDRYASVYNTTEGHADLVAAIAEERAANGPIDLCIIDTASRFAGISLDKDSAAGASFISACNTLSAAADGLVLCVAHTNKTSRSAEKGAAESLDVRGTSALTDNARGVLQLMPEVDRSTRKPTGLVALSLTKKNHVTPWADIILRRRPEDGVLEPLGEVDRALFEAERRPPSPEDREAERNTRKDREEAAARDRAQKRRTEVRAAMDAEAKAALDADAGIVRQIIAEGYTGKLRDRVTARLACGTARAGRAIARAQEDDTETPDCEEPHVRVSRSSPPQIPPYPPVSGDTGDTGGVGVSDSETRDTETPPRHHRDTETPEPNLFDGPDDGNGDAA